MKTLLAAGVLLGIAGGSAAGEAPGALRNLTPYAKPMCGTEGFGNTFPGAVAPFGMIQWSPDTGEGRRYGGYSYKDTRIAGFSLDRMSGAGCPYGENFSFMPMLGSGGPPPELPPERRSAFSAGFSHDSESARPGYYAVTLDNGIKVELTATVRTGFGRFTYPAAGREVLAIDAASAINGAERSSVRVDPARREVSGWAVGGHFCSSPAETTIYFCARFDRPFTESGTWGAGAAPAGNAHRGTSASGALIAFDPAPGRVVLAKVAISYVSVANAEANLEAENPASAFSSADFDRAVAAADAAWNARLNRIQVGGGPRSDMETFYSMLYHAYLAPTVCSDVNGQYMGYDGKVHEGGGRTHYANFSGWDTYRSECQLLAVIAPDEAGDMAQSLLDDFRQGGTFPRWGVPNADSGVMIGDCSAPMIADFYMFGGRNFEALAALNGLVKAGSDPSVMAPRTLTGERDGLAEYLKLGYVPETYKAPHPKGGYGNVSMTLEYASDDFALSQFAEALGDHSDAAEFLERAQHWTNLFNPETRCIQMRREDGSWAPGFVNNAASYDGHQGYAEGTAEQYTWMVPFNLKELSARMGGPEAAEKRLDAFFTKLNVGYRSADSWMAYMGNEPCLETPWIYDFLGCPWKTQRVVRRIMTELYSAGNNGFPGNDDLGEMASWYVFGALGMYPELPGSDVLVFGSPMFEEAVIHLPKGDVTIRGAGAGKDAPYVQALDWKGAPWSKPWIRFADLETGGTLAFTLGSNPNPKWGSAPADAPPSYGSRP
jgi:predicted alpha-1,2-mannosidase